MTTMETLKALKIRKKVKRSLIGPSAAGDVQPPNMQVMIMMSQMRPKAVTTRNLLKLDPHALSCSGILAKAQRLRRIRSSCKVSKEAKDQASLCTSTSIQNRTK
jgi:hypothetical protein